ncbi:MAG: hypothetical protein SH868_03130 [Bythopirellula sp.]|nr:hypothetical protein [Bythopirellula sp.]
MSTIVEATFDGNVFHPTSEVPLLPNTIVRLTVETMPPNMCGSTSFLKTARELNLEGPADWSSNLDQYLYDKESDLGQ